MTAPTPPGVWIVRRDRNGVLNSIPARFITLEQCDMAFYCATNPDGYFAEDFRARLRDVVAAESEGEDGVPKR